MDYITKQIIRHLELKMNVIFILDTSEYPKIDGHVDYVTEHESTILDFKMSYS